MEIVISVLAGGLISWCITYWYNKINNKNQIFLNNELRKKLSADVINIIKSSQKENMTILELNRLLEGKVIDNNKDDPLPYKACPKCGNENLKRSSSHDNTHNRLFYIITCDKCHWSEWTE